MTNLSELSKPVAWKLHHHDRYYFEENADVVAIAESMAQAKGDAVYSQEYVSALLAERDAFEASALALRDEWRASKKSNAFLKEQLAKLANFNPDWDMLEACRESWREVTDALKEAEAKLATPVRLPNKNDAEFWFGSTFQVAKFDRAVERAISAAGFKFVGDE